MAAEFKFSDEAQRTGLLVRGEFAALFGVGKTTIDNWRKCGKLPAAIRTPGGQYRYSLATVRSILNGGQR